MIVSTMAMDIMVEGRQNNCRQNDFKQNVCIQNYCKQIDYGHNG